MTKNNNNNSNNGYNNKDNRDVVALTISIFVQMLKVTAADTEVSVAHHYHYHEYARVPHVKSANNAVIQPCNGYELCL